MVLLIYPTNQGISSTLIVILLRRQLLAIAALSIISWSSTLQTFVVGVILVGFAIIHLCFYPYSDLPHHNFASENSFEPLILLVLSISFILLRFSALESSMSSTTASVWIIIVINSWILLLLICIIFYRLIITGYENLGGCFCSGSGANAERTNFQSVNQFAVREQPTLGERWWEVVRHIVFKAKVGCLSTFSEVSCSQFVSVSLPPNVLFAAKIFSVRYLNVLFF